MKTEVVREEEMVAAPLYTVFTLTSVEHTEEAPHEVFTHPHNPRKCLANLKGIATGVDFGIAGEELLTQEEAEALMATTEWQSPVEEEEV